MQRPCRKGEEIEVTVQQVTKEGKINQVKID
jgi:predicted RNA-binding protein with TRAM domain